MEIHNQNIHTNPAQTAAQIPDEVWRKSIPAQVFLNHFYAIAYLLRHDIHRYDLHKLDYFNKLKLHPEARLERVKQLLLNAWNTEFALRNTLQPGSEEMLRYALHWTFPQAFYSIFLGTRAFMECLGISDARYEQLRFPFGRLVAEGAYPPAIGYYTSGHYGDFHLHRLHASHFRPGLHPATHALEAAAEVGQFLSTTRRMQAWECRNRIQKDPSRAIRSERNGKVLEKFGPTQWEKITSYVGYTTVLDLVARLRLSASQHEIERFVQSDIDFRLFYDSLSEMAAYFSFVHEAYIAKAIGCDQYRQILDELPPYLKDGFAAERYRRHILPLFEIQGDLFQTAA